MTVNITDVDAFTSPVTAPADGEPVNSAGIIASPIQALSNRTFNLLNAEQGPEVSGSRFAIIPASTSNLSGPAGGLGSEWSQNVAGVRSKVNDAEMIHVIDGSHVPHGVTVTKLEMMLQMGATRAGPTLRTRVLITRANYDWATPLTGNAFMNSAVFIAAANVTTLQVLDITISELPFAWDQNRPLFFDWRAGNDGATNNDDLYALRVTWDSP